MNAEIKTHFEAYINDVDFDVEVEYLLILKIMRELEREVGDPITSFFVVEFVTEFVFELVRVEKLDMSLLEDGWNFGPFKEKLFKKFGFISNVRRIIKAEKTAYIRGKENSSFVGVET